MSSLHSHEVFQGEDDSLLAYLHPPELSSSPPPGFHLISLGLEWSSVPRYIIISDAAWKNDENREGLDWSLLQTTLNDNVGKGGYDFGSASSAVHAEALACLKSLKWALKVHLTSVEVYTDSFNLVSMLQGDSTQDIRLVWTLKEIRNRGKLFTTCTIRKVDKNMVAGAHNKAQLAIGILKNDARGVAFPRFLPLDSLVAVCLIYFLKINA
uniref:RNase H type-1 domain-containing protein n=1 Tax=Chenopodium quinoa TaxID=63459 RepID=A0A803MAL9_CHEQI